MTNVSEKITIDLSPPPEFLAACRKVLGDDSPATVIGAMRNGDPRMNHVHALAVQDPSLWLCSAIDPNGIPRLWAKASTESEARHKAELAVTSYRESKQSYRMMEPRADWQFVMYPPDEHEAARRAARLRRLAAKHNYRLVKSRAKPQKLHADDRGLYQLVDDHNTVVTGSRFDASLNEVASCLNRIT